MPTNRAPLRYLGGKTKLAAKILPLLDVPHTTYVEPFAGGASIFFAKPPSPVEVLNDADGAVVTFFRVLQSDDLRPLLLRRLKNTPYSRAEFERARCLLRCPHADDVSRAWSLFIANRQSFAGRTGNSWGFSVATSTKKMAMPISSTNSALNALPQFADRLRLAQIEHADFAVVLARFDGRSTLFYCDPPYIDAASSSGGRCFAHDLSAERHAELLAQLCRLDGMVALSGYAGALYSQKLAGWKQLKIAINSTSLPKTKSSGILGKGAAAEKGKRGEIVFVNERLADAIAKRGGVRLCDVD